MGGDRKYQDEDTDVDLSYTGSTKTNEDYAAYLVEHFGIIRFCNAFLRKANGKEVRRPR